MTEREKLASATEALVPHLPKPLSIWDPATGSGQIAKSLSDAGFRVDATDITTGFDFLECTLMDIDNEPDAIITNPPKNLTVEFVEHALILVQQAQARLVAMLLPADLDQSDVTSNVFQDCPVFAKKLVIGQPADPNGEVFAWFIWDWEHEGPPALTHSP